MHQNMIFAVDCYGILLTFLSKSRSVRGEAFKQPNPPDDGSRIIEPAVAIMVGPAVPSATFQG